MINLKLFCFDIRIDEDHLPEAELVASYIHFIHDLGDDLIIIHYTLKVISLQKHSEIFPILQMDTLCNQGHQTLYSLESIALYLLLSVASVTTNARD